MALYRVVQPIFCASRFDPLRFLNYVWRQRVISYGKYSVFMPRQKSLSGSQRSCKSGKDTRKIRQEVHKQGFCVVGNGKKERSLQEFNAMRSVKDVQTIETCRAFKSPIFVHAKWRVFVFQRSTKAQ